MPDPFDLDDLSRELAKTELHENPASKVQQIEALKKWIVTHNYVECRTDDAFILRFLRVAKFSTEACKERIEKFCISRTSKLDGIPEWYADQNTKNPEYRAILDTGLIYPLPEPDSLGRVVIVTNYGIAAKFDPEKSATAASMMMDYILSKFPRAQINGVIMLENAGGYNKEQMKYWNMERVPKAISIMQNANPMRIKQIYWYNIPAFARLVMEGGLLIMRSKIRERLTINSKYDPPKDVPLHVLPPMFGGTGKSWEELKDDVLTDLYNHQSEFDMLKMCKIIESKRPKHVEQGDSWGISGTYIQTGSG